jgi:signal transduction histidine kinase
MKVFDVAILKLTAIYSGILLVVCVGFSVAIYGSALNSFDRKPMVMRPFDAQTEVENFMRQRDEEIKQQMMVRLIIINICVLVGGVFTSYFLAKLTLKPVHENMKAQEQFVANASHELRTPLSTMRMENEVMRRDKKATKEDYAQLIDSNLEEVDKLSGLCSRLLMLSHNEKMAISEFDVAEAVAEAVLRVELAAKVKNIRIINEARAMRIDANFEALVEILEILLENAVKYSPRETVVTIGNDERRIFVRDEGVGIAEEDLPHIFERFYRAEKSHTTEGHGLGLALAERLAEQQNLRISVQNNSEKGVTFTIC